MRLLLRDLEGNTKGVTLIEYALIAGLISLVSITMLTAMGSSVKNLFTSINNSLTSA
jgi:pilus assembly protein Flp/PilA